MGEEYPKMKKILRYNGKIITETGLYIGGLNDKFTIGGSDAFVIREFVNLNGKRKLLPFIPGSSLKGRMRALLELSDPNIKISNGKNSDNGFVRIGNNKIKYEGKAKVVLTMFGRGAQNTSEELNITRLIVRDAYPTPETIKFWDSSEEIYNGASIKGENTIDRLTSKADPRFFERVPAGSSFYFEVLLLVFDGDDEEEMKKTIEKGFKLVEMNYLGGSGTRGWGRVRFEFEEKGKEVWNLTQE